jgi:hypothetical protein
MRNRFILITGHGDVDIAVTAMLTVENDARGAVVPFTLHWPGKMIEKIHSALIDDDPAVLDSLQLYLQRNGVKVSCFAAAEEFSSDGGRGAIIRLCDHTRTHAESIGDRSCSSNDCGRRSYSDHSDHRPRGC